MRDESLKYLYDIQHAYWLLVRFTEGKTLNDNLDDPTLRSAAERQFEIIGEAIGQLARIDRQTAARLTGYPRMVSFRNILIHAYADVDDRLVWDVIETHLPTLGRDLGDILGTL